MTEEEIKQKAEKNASTYSELDEWQRVKEAYIKGATEATKDLQSQLTEKDKHIEELKKQINWKEKALAKSKKENEQKIHRVIKDNKRLIRRNTEYKAELEQWKSEWHDQVQESTEEGFARIQLQIKNKELEEKIKTLEHNKKTIAHLSSILEQKQKEQLDYAKSIIKSLLDNSDEYARERAENFLKEIRND